MNQSPAPHKAEAIADAHLGFLIHVGIYVVVNALLIAINLANRPDHIWFHWPLIGWGIGVLFHGLALFAFPQVRERMIERQRNRKKS